MTGNTQTHGAQSDAPEQTKSSVDTLMEYRVEIIAILVILVALVGLMSYVKSASQAAEEAASADVFRAAYQSQSMGTENTLNELKLISERHRGTNAVAFVLRQELQLLYSEGKYAEAEKAGRDFLSQYGENSFAPAVRLNLARILMCQKKYDEAATLLSTLRRQNVSYLTPEVTLAQAECFLAQGKVEEAKAAFQQISDSPEYSPVFRSQAEFGLVVLQARNDAGVTLPAALQPKALDLSPEAVQDAAGDAAATVKAEAGDAASTAK